MIGDFEEILSLIREIDAECRRSIDLYLIGGGALMASGFRDTTKDLDLVVSCREDYEAAVSALYGLGFRTEMPGVGYERMAISRVLVRGGQRVDLFNTRVCGGFSLSETIASRSSKKGEFSKVNFRICALSDIFLFKTITLREGDHMDCFNIARSTFLDWRSFLEEIRAQASGTPDLGVIFVAERLSALRDGGIEVPIVDDILQICDDSRRGR